MGGILGQGTIGGEMGNSAELEPDRTQPRQW